MFFEFIGKKVVIEDVRKLAKELEESKKENESLVERNKSTNLRYNKLSSEFQNKELKLREELEMDRKKIVASYEIKLEKELLKKERELIKKQSEFTDTTLKETYEKLSNSLETLHTEGTSQTKFVQNLSMEMMKANTPRLSNDLS